LFFFFMKYIPHFMFIIIIIIIMVFKIILKLPLIKFKGNIVIQSIMILLILQQVEYFKIINCRYILKYE